jgi:hypothetical protein
LEPARLFHFSDDPGIERFVPRPVRVPSSRPPGQDWLNGPLVWAIAESHAFLYLFPRECPRILAWSRPETTTHDRAQWLGTARAVAFIEAGWLERLETDALTRYEFPTEPFEDLGDAGMWVSRQPVGVIDRLQLSGLPQRLAERAVRLEVVESLVPLRHLWDTSLQVSGIRLRNDRGWPV